MGAFNHVRHQAWAALMAGLVMAIGSDATSTTTTSATTSATVAVSAIPTPGTFEVDLLFPRNSTYTPQALMPIVFALQNPTLASQLEASLNWQLWEGNNRSSPGSVTDGLMELSLTNDLSSSEPFLFYRFVNTIAYPDGSWTLSWDLLINNCSQPPGSSKSILTQSNTAVFTTSSSGQAPDLMAATSADMCGTVEASAFNVTSSGDFCGVLGASPTTNPCAATIHPAAVSSISASASAQASLICVFDKSQQHPGINCSTSTSSASSADAVGRSLMPAASALLMLLVMLTTLIPLG